jgi:hypothetical protein
MQMGIEKQDLSPETCQILWQYLRAESFCAWKSCRESLLSLAKSAADLLSGHQKKTLRFGGGSSDASKYILMLKYRFRC